MKYFLFFSIIIFFVTPCFGQSGFKRNDIYLEAGGNGLFASFSYERQFTKHPGIGARIGIGYYSENASHLTIPAAINYLFKLKSDKSFLDAGLGVTWTRLDGNGFGQSDYSRGAHFVNFVPNIGYRRHTSKDLMWRINVTPITNKFGFTPWLGISLGKRF